MAVKIDANFEGKLTKWHEEFGKFLPQHSKVSKLKFTEELWIMTMKNDATFREELICCFKIDIRNLTNFDPSAGESQQFAL